MYSAMEPDASYPDLSGFLVKMATNRECDELNTPIIEEKKHEFDFTSSSDVLVPMADDSDIWGLDSPFSNESIMISPNTKMESKYLDEPTFLTPKNEENDIIVNQLVDGINPDFNVSNESLSLQSNAYFTSDNTTTNVVTHIELLDCVEGKTSSTLFDKTTFVPHNQDNEKKLKLNLSLAPPQLETTVISTPDVVQQILSHETNFDLLAYVFDEEKTSPKHRNLAHNSKTSKRSTLLKNSKLLNNNVDNNYNSTVEKASKVTPSSTTPLITIDDSLLRSSSSSKDVKVEDIIKVETSLYEEPTSSTSLNNKKQVSTKPAARRGRPPGRRNNPPKRQALSPLSMHSEEDSDWVLKSTDFPNKRKRTTSIMSTDSNQSNQSSVALCSKYRELRDRNNEASRKSRMNRKVREEEMNDKLLLLEKENLKLKVKAEELERLVQEMRNALISAFKKK